MDWDQLENWLVARGHAKHGGWAPSTANERIGDLQRMAREGFPVENPTETDVDAYLAQRRRQGASTAARENDVIALNALMRFHWREQPEDAPQWDVPKREPAQKTWLSDAELRRLRNYEHPDEHINRFRRALVHFAWETALRPSEAYRVELDDLDESGERPHLWIETTSKMGVRRPIYFRPEFTAPTRPFGAYLTWRRELEHDDPDLWIVGHDSHGRWDPHPVSYSYFRDLLRRVGEAVGVDVDWQTMRRTRATRLLRLGWPVTRVSHLLGHQQIETTMEYLQVRQEDLLEQTIENPPPSLYQI